MNTIFHQSLYFHSRLCSFSADGVCTRVYPEVSGLVAWSENWKW